jgi:hypothetical protein
MNSSIILQIGSQDKEHCRYNAYKHEALKREVKEVIDEVLLLIERKVK